MVNSIKCLTGVDCRHVYSTSSNAKIFHNSYVYFFTTTDSKSFTLWSPDWSVVHTFVVHATFMLKQRGKLLGLFISGSRHWSVWRHVKSERFPFFRFPFFLARQCFPSFRFPLFRFPFFRFLFFRFLSFLHPRNTAFVTRGTSKSKLNPSKQ